MDDLWSDEEVESMQSMIDSGVVWQLEGAMGRAAMDMMHAGYVVLGETGHRDYWGNYVPSRHEVEPGTLGSVEYADRVQGEV